MSDQEDSSSKVVLDYRQEVLINAIATLLNETLAYWPRKSGKTTVRKLLAERIIADDDHYN